MFSTCYQGELYAQRSTERQRSSDRHVQPRSQGADCGTSRAAPSLPAIDASDAIRNILAAAPEKVFMGASAVCSVCLDTYSDEAVQASARPGPAASVELRK